jgi:twitching motility protein PilT
MSKVSRQLGQMLLEQRLLTKDVLEEQTIRSESTGVPLARILIDTGQVRESDILRVVADRLQIPFVDFNAGKGEHVVDRSVAARLDPEVARRLEALPVSITPDGEIQVAVADPFNDQKSALLRKALGTAISAALAPRVALRRTIDEVYALLATMPSETAATAPINGAAVRAAVEESLDGNDRPHVNDLLQRLLEMGGSDLHLAAGSAPQVRVNGDLVPLDEFPMMKPAMLRTMLYEILTARQREQLEESRELDCSHPLPGKGRFRVNVMFQRDSVGAVMRAIPNEIASLEALGMPPVVSEFAHYKRGIVLVTGPTGSGKSTTLASVIDLVNSTRSCHVMTVEDPIEFMHRHKKAIVNQREVGADTLSFAAALKHALRQDPDVILVGEIRDLETISTAITAAETGHLVFATLHTQDAPQSIDRIIDSFPADQQQQVRVQVAGSIQAVVSQQLVPMVHGGRIAAVEIMVANPAIRNMVREGKVHQIHSVMQAGAKYGMQTMDQALAHHVKAGRISHEVALERCHNPDDFHTLAGGGR